MSTSLIETNKPQRYVHQVRNAESSSIPIGTPLVLNLSGTKQPSTYQNGLPAGFEDGLQVVLPASGGAFAANFFRYGVALETIVTKQLGRALLFGVVNAIVKYATRAASTDSWSASATQAASALLTIDTIDNCFTTVASSSGIASNAAVSMYTAAQAAVLLDTIATVTASASATSDSRTALTAMARVFLRQM